MGSIKRDSKNEVVQDRECRSQVESLVFVREEITFYRMEGMQEGKVRMCTLPRKFSVWKLSVYTHSFHL